MLKVKGPGAADQVSKRAGLGLSACPSVIGRFSSAFHRALADRLRLTSSRIIMQATNFVKIQNLNDVILFAANNPTFARYLKERPSDVAKLWASSCPRRRRG